MQMGLLRKGLEAATTWLSQPWPLRICLVHPKRYRIAIDSDQDVNLNLQWTKSRMIEST